MRVRLALDPDGSLGGEPVVVNDSTDLFFATVAQSSVRAVERCAPITAPAKLAPYYRDWKSVTIDFDARDAL